MSSLFAYGSLMFPDVISIVLGRPLSRKDLSNAVLKDYRRIAVPGRSYPTGIPAIGSWIHGKLIAGLTDDDIQRLDAYEESFYIRNTVTVETERGTQEAFAYIDGRHPLPFPMEEWDAEAYEKEHLPAFVKEIVKKRQTVTIPG